MDSTQPQKMTLQTEDTGKIFEMAICMAYGIEFDGKYKYSMEAAEQLKPRLAKLTEHFPMCKHTAKKAARYDFTSVENSELHLSAKTVKHGSGKVAPQVVGQSQPKKFCESIGTEFTTIPALKEYIQKEIHKILPILVDYTFDCPNLYYHKEKNSIQYISNYKEINWSKYNISWTRKWEEWTNSSTLKIHIGDKEFALLEIQFHTKSRTNMAVRWYYDNFLDIFPHHFTIVNF